MDDKRLAFTLLKTVVVARDLGRPLAPQLFTAWAMIRGELSAGVRKVADELTWRRERTSDIKCVLAAVATCLRAEPGLAAAVVPLLSESPPQAEVLLEGEREPRPEPAAHVTLVSGAAISPRARRTLVTAVLGAAALLCVVAAYATFSRAGRGTPLTLAPGPPSVGIAPAERVASTPVAAAPTLRRAAPLRAAGEYEAARDAQRQQVAALDAAEAPADVRSRAYVELATLSAADGRYREAVEAQREGLELAYASTASDTLALGRTHLALGRYYQLTGQNVIARAHLRQARHYARRSEELPDARQVAREALALDEALADGR